MSQIMLKSQDAIATLVSNNFIDDYLIMLNEAQIKIYLYLLRHLSDGVSVTVADIADYFNYTEKDVMRSLNRMRMLGLLSIDYDREDNIVSIGINSYIPAAADRSIPAADRIIPAPGMSIGSPAGRQAASEDPASPEHFYPADRVSAFKDREDVRQLIFVTETHLAKDLTLSDTNTLLFIYDELHFPVELIEYLVEYCVNGGKRSMRYIEKVAIGWAESGITTLEQAKSKVSSTHYKECYAVLKELGITSRSVTRSDIEFVTKWLEEYKLGMDVILEACRRNICSISKPSYTYIDSILRRWKSAGVSHVSDIAKADEDYRTRARSRSGSRAPASSPGNRFKNFKESGRDFNAVVNELMSSQVPL